MLNNFRLNNNQLNHFGLEYNELSETYPYIINGIAFPSEPVDPSSYILLTNFRDPRPTKIRSTLSNARSDGQKIISSVFKERTLYFDLAVHKSTESDLRDYLDNIMSKLYADDLEILVNNQSEQRRFYGNLTNQPFDDWFAYPRNYIETTLEFTCFDPFGYSLQADNQRQEAVTSSSVDVYYNNSGSYDSWLYLVFIANSGANITNITITNQENSDSLDISHTLVDGERLDVDSKNRTITEIVGATLTNVNPDGRFIKVKPNSNRITIEITGTSIDYDVLFNSIPTYI